MSNNGLFPSDEFHTEMFEDEKEIARRKLEEKKNMREKNTRRKADVHFFGIFQR